MGRFVTAIVLASALTSVTSDAGASDCTNVSTGLIPLMDLGTGTYKGMVGGLYGAGSNEPPAAHAANGLQAASRVVPRSRTGAPSSTGRVVLISIGMSNTTMEFRAFQELVRNDGCVSPSLTVVDWRSRWRDGRRLGRSCQRRMVGAGQAAEGHRCDPRASAGRVGEGGESRRVDAGYASTMLNPEPYAYESGFVVKRIIQRQIAGQLPIQPWLAWGPYLWADGLVPRSDGLTWQCSDFNSDGTHPSASGRRKVAERLLEFFESDDTATRWFLR